MTDIEELFTAINWISPAPEEDVQGGDEECPIMAAYEIAHGYPPFLHIAFDELHAHGYEALGNFVVNWVEEQFGRAPETTGEVLYGIPIPYEGVDLTHWEDRIRAAPTIYFVETVLGDPNAIIPAEQLSLIDLSRVENPADYDPGKAENPLDYDGEDEDLGLDTVDEDEREEVNHLARLVSDFGQAARIVFCSIWETQNRIHSVDNVWLDIACAIGWAFSATGNMSVDYTENEIADGGWEMADWNDYEPAHSAVQEALLMMKRVDPGRDAILFNPTARRILCENLKLARSLLKEHTHDAYKHCTELRWPSLSTAIERWADSPARHLRQRGGRTKTTRPESP